MTLLQRFSVLVIVAMAVTPMVKAQANLGPIGVGGKLGLILPSDPAKNTLGLGAVAEAKLDRFLPGLAFNPFIDFWSSSYNVFTLKHSRTLIAFGGVVKYYVPLSTPLPMDAEPYAGGGLSLNVERDSWKGFGRSDSKTELNIAIHLVGGAEVPLSPTLNGFAEIKLAVDGNDYFAIMAGAIFKLGK